MAVGLWSLIGLAVGLVLVAVMRLWSTARGRGGPAHAPRAAVLLPPIGLATAFGVVAALGATAAELLAAAPLLAALLLLAAVDLGYRVVPNELVFPAALLGVVVAFDTTPQAAALTGLAAAGVFLLLLLLGERLVGRGALGMGDVKLTIAIGTMLGPPLAPTALLFGVLLAGGVAVGLLLAGRGRQTTLPYGCCLALAAAAVLVLAVVR